MLVFIASEAMFFVGLIGANIVLHFSTPDWPRVGDASRPLNAGVAAVATLLLLASSVALHLGFSRRSPLRVAIALVFGFVFVAMQVAEYRLLIGHGLTLRSSVFASSFYLLTSLHLAHVAAGLLAIGWHSTKVRVADAAILGAVAAYWHFVDFVWIVLFVVLYVW